MASNIKLLPTYAMLIVVVMTIIPKITCTEFIVGDGYGWRLNFDYKAWGKGKDFRVGDKLVFKYPKGVHNVMKVNPDGFMKCIRAPLSNTLSTGNDTIMLKTPGKKWYICGVSTHCKSGLKLALNVKPNIPPPPAFTTPSFKLGKKVFVVGDDKGWTLGFDYRAWVKGKRFHVGDRLVFKYPVGAHTVMAVDGPSFKNCAKKQLRAPLTTGNDTIVFAKPGKKWYICSIGKHCEGGMKLLVNVRPLPKAP